MSRLPPLDIPPTDLLGVPGVEVGRACMNHVSLDDLTLEEGNHHSRAEGVCVMEAVAYFAGLAHTDKPPCTDAVVTRYAQVLNDRMPDDQRQRLIPYIPRLATTANGTPAKQRAFLCADRAVRVFAVMALRERFPEQAEKLAALPVIDSLETAKQGRVAAAAAYAAANAAAAVAAADAAANATAAAAAAANAAANATYAANANEVWDEALRLLDDLIEMKA